MKYIYNLKQKYYIKYMHDLKWPNAKFTRTSLQIFTYTLSFQTFVIFVC